MVNSILNDDDAYAIGQTHYLPSNKVRAIEAAVLAKLREQEPVAWLLYFTNEHGESVREIFFYKAHVERHKTHNETVRGLKCRIEPLYAAPLPAVAQVQVPDDVRRCAKAMQKNHYKGPLAWVVKVIDWVADAPEAPAQEKQ